MLNKSTLMVGDKRNLTGDLKRSVGKGDRLSSRVIGVTNDAKVRIICFSNKGDFLKFNI